MSYTQQEVPGSSAKREKKKKITVVLACLREKTSNTTLTYV